MGRYIVEYRTDNGREKFNEKETLDGNQADLENLIRDIRANGGYDISATMITEVDITPEYKYLIQMGMGDIKKATQEEVDQGYPGWRVLDAQKDADKNGYSVHGSLIVLKV